MNVPQKSWFFFFGSFRKNRLSRSVPVLRQPRPNQSSPWRSSERLKKPREKVPFVGKPLLNHHFFCFLFVFLLWAEVFELRWELFGLCEIWICLWSYGNGSCAPLAANRTGIKIVHRTRISSRWKLPARKSTIFNVKTCNQLSSFSMGDCSGALYTS